MRILGIDYGDKRTGLAVGDTDIGIATPFGEVRTSNALSELKKIVADEKIGKIVLGLPVSFRMEETEESKKARLFGDALARDSGLSVEYENEILTSSQVERELGEKSHAASAALILQSFLDRNRI